MTERLYDALMAALERMAVREWRDQLWRAVPAHGRGLEIGAGTGANLPFYPAGARVTASELRPTLFRGALRRGVRTRAEPVVADVQALPFRDGAFDWAVATLVFCEVPDPLRGLRETRRVLKPGGRLYLLEHVKPSGRLGDVARLATRLTAPLFGEHYDRETASVAASAGFRIERERRWWRDAVVLLESVRD